MKLETTEQIREAFIRQGGWADQLREASGDQERWQTVVRILNHLQPFYLNPAYLLEKNEALDEYQGRVKEAIERAAVAQLSSDLAVRRAIEHVQSIKDSLANIDQTIKGFDYIREVDLLSQRVKEVRSKIEGLCELLKPKVRRHR